MRGTVGSGWTGQDRYWCAVETAAAVVLVLLVVVLVISSPRDRRRGDDLGYRSSSSSSSDRSRLVRLVGTVMTMATRAAVEPTDWERPSWMNMVVESTPPPSTGRRRPCLSRRVFFEQPRERRGATRTRTRTASSPSMSFLHRPAIPAARPVSCSRPRLGSCRRLQLRVPSPTGPA